MVAATPTESTPVPGRRSRGRRASGRPIGANHRRVDWNPAKPAGGLARQSSSEAYRLRRMSRGPTWSGRSSPLMLARRSSRVPWPTVRSSSASASGAASRQAQPCPSSTQGRISVVGGKRRSKASQTTPPCTTAPTALVPPPMSCLQNQLSTTPEDLSVEVVRPSGSTSPCHRVRPHEARDQGACSRQVAMAQFSQQ
eukprot:scaffold21975_cov84-Isochrysis_galbana.AAC.1